MSFVRRGHVGRFLERPKPGVSEVRADSDARRPARAESESRARGIVRTVADDE
jgi:hypothetical protein